MTIDVTAPLAEDSWGLLRKRGITDQSAVPNVLRALALNPTVLALWFSSDLNDGQLSKHDQELVILHIAHRCGSGYIWAKHADGAGAVARPSVSAEAILAIRSDATSTSTAFDARDRLLLSAAESCASASTIDPAILRPLVEAIGDAGVLELIHLVARYHFLAWTVNSFGVPIEDAVPAPELGGTA